MEIPGKGVSHVVVPAWDMFGMDRGLVVEKCCGQVAGEVVVVGLRSWGESGVVEPPHCAAIVGE